MELVRLKGMLVLIVSIYLQLLNKIHASLINNLCKATKYFDFQMNMHWKIIN